MWKLLVAPEVGSTSTQSLRSTSALLFSGLALSLIVLMSLFIYKWGAAFRAIIGVQSAGTYKTPSELISTAGLPFVLASGARTINYLAIVWPALVFGVLIAGLVRALISPNNVRTLLGSGPVRRQLVGGVLGMPLMLCSCCIAPIFASVYTQGARLGSSLAIMLGSPSLNVAALFLTFLLFPQDMALARMGMAIFAVFVLPAVIERLTGGGVQPNPSGSLRPSDVAPPQSLLGMMRSWITSSGSIALRTLPLILLGVYASGLLVGWFEHPSAGKASTGLIIAAVAFLATLTALPTFFEIPFGILLLANGFPPGAVAALLFAGPALNMPSLFTLARVSSRKVALLAFLGVWGTASIGGLLVQFGRL